MQGTQVLSLAWEDFTYHGAINPMHHTTEPVLQSLGSAIREATSMRSLHVATRESLCIATRIKCHQKEEINKLIKCFKKTCNKFKRNKGEWGTWKKYNSSGGGGVLITSWLKGASGWSKYRKLEGALACERRIQPLSRCAVPVPSLFLKSFFPLSSGFVVVQSLSCVVIPWPVPHQASLAFTISWSLLKLTSIESVIPSNHIILCHPLLLLPSIFPSIRVFPNELTLHIRRPKYWSSSFSISPANEYSELISFRIDWFDLAVPGTSWVFSSTAIRKHQFFGT